MALVQFSSSLSSKDESPPHPPRVLKGSSKDMDTVLVVQIGLGAIVNLIDDGPPVYWKCFKRR